VEGAGVAPTYSRL